MASVRSTLPADRSERAESVMDAATLTSLPVPARLDRLPPHALQAEQGVLGCILVSPQETLPECVKRLSASTAFYDLRHRALYETLAAMADQQKSIDLITVCQALSDGGQLDGVGGPAYLTNLIDATPSAANLRYYLDIVVEKFVLRRVLAACANAIDLVHSREGEVDALLDEIERDILQINRDREAKATPLMRDLIKKSIDLIERYHARDSSVTGLSTGFGDLDKMTNGLRGGEMIVIAARPSMGKTSLAMNIAEHVALELKQPVGVFSLEMTAEALALRMLCSVARVNGRNVRDGFLTEADFQKITRAAGELSRAPLFIDDTAGLSILQLRARARRMSQQNGLKMVVIDYLQLMHSTSRKAADNRQQEIAEISTGIKGLAKELGVPVIVLSQLNRDIEKEKNRKPRLSDLRESGAIEQDADLVGLLYKPDGSDDEAGGSNPMDAVPVNLLVAKQRNGPTGDVRLTFLKGLTRFETAAKIAEE